MPELHHPRGLTPRDTRTFVQRSARHPLTGLMWCGLCGHLLRSSIVGSVLTYYCSDVLGGCAHIRIKAEDVERYLLEEIQQRLATTPLPGLDDPVLAALRLQQHQLQDDHYDHLLNRADYVRQAKRLAARVADRRRELTGGWQRAHVEPLILTAEPDDPAPQRRAALRHHLARVEVDPHPRGRGTAAASGWELRRQVVASRLRPIWQDADQDQPDVTAPGVTMADSAPWVSPG